MNVRFPKAQNFISALLEIGITRFVPLCVRGLNGIQSAAIDSRVSVPEISVPLDDDGAQGNENVDNKLATDHLLLQIINLETVKNGRPCTLKPIWGRLVWKAENSRYALLLCCSISASIRAVIPIALPNKPTGDIERFPAGRAASHFPASSFLECALSRFLFSLWCSLPSIGAIQRTEPDNSPRRPPILKRCAAPFAGKHIAGITPLCAVGTWHKRLSAFLAGFTLGDVLYSHNSIIPWRVGVVKCRSS
jgi:hypothetical protein